MRGRLLPDRHSLHDLARMRVELQAHGTRDHAWYDRSDLPVGGADTPDHLHARGATIREFNMKRRDPITEGLHRVRENIGKTHDFDVHRIAAAIRQHEDENPESVP